MPEQLAVLGHDPDVQAVDQHDHALALVGVPHPDVVKARPLTKGELPVLVDAIPTHPDPRTDADPRP